MTIALILDIGREALIMVLLLSGPLLLVGLVVGLMVGVFQAVTQINEMTLTFIPKILAIFATLMILFPWMTIKLIDFTRTLIQRIPEIIK